MSASGAEQVQDPVLAATDPVISHEDPVPVDGQILKDVSNLGSNETPEGVAAGLVSLNKADASNGAVGPTTSADETENAPSHEQSAFVEDAVFVHDKEVIIHGSDIALEKTKDVQDAPVVEVDNAAFDSITADNVDDTTLNEKDNEIIAVKDIPNTPEVESVATVEHGIPADSDLIAPVAKITEANTIDDSVNDSAIEIPAPVLEKNQGCAKDNEDDAVPADDVKLAETGNRNETVQIDKRDATDNVDGTPEMNEALNGETLAQAKGNVVNVDVDIASSAVEGDALDIDAVPETKEENASMAMAEAPVSNVTDSVVAQVDAADVSVEPAASMKDNLSSDHVGSAAAASETVAEAQEDVPNGTVEGIVEQTEGEDAPAVAEEVAEATPTEADLNEDGAVVATETEIAVESNDAGVTTEEVEQGGFDETSAETMNSLDVEPLVEVVEVGHEVEPAAEDVNNIEKTSSHEKPVRSAVEEEPKVTEVAVRVVEEIPDTGEDAAVAVDETTAAPETVEEPTNDTEASISAPVEVESISSDTNIVHEVEVTYEEGRPAPEVEPVVANETIAAPVDEVPNIPEEETVDAGVEVEAEVSASVEGESVPASDTLHEAASVTVEEEVVPASAVITEPVIESEDVETVTPETTNEEASEKVEVEPVTADEEVIAAPVDEPVTTEAVAEVDNEEVSVQVETEPIATPVDEHIAPVTESEVPPEDAAAPETSVEKYEEAPVTIEVQYVENIAEEANEETTVSALAEPVAETEGVTEKASEVETAGHDNITPEVPGSVEPDSIPTSDEVAATVVEVAEEPVPASIELSEETFATTVNVENEEIPASVDALDETTVVEAKSAPIETPVEAAVAASLEAEHDVAGEAIAVAEDDSEPSVPGEELTTTIPEAATPQVDDEATHEEASDITTLTTQVADEAVPLSIHGPDADNTVVEAQATHTKTPGEIGLDTEPSTAVAEGEAVAEETPAPAVEAAGVEDAPETTQEACATLERGLKGPPHIVEAENAGISANVLELVGKEASDIGSTDVSAPVAEVIATAAGQGDDVAVEESTSAPVVESVALKENVPELRTGVISIETSLDTTPFTPVLDSGIGFKEQEPAPSTLSSIAEEIERPKPSWGPSSFQVSTVGGVESSGVGDAGSVLESTELAETGEPASVPLLVVEDAPVNEHGASEDFVSVDQPSSERPWTYKIEDETLNPQQSSQVKTNPNLENELPPRPWTPSFAVHSQGSPAAIPKEVEEAPPLDAESIEQSIPETTAATSFPIDAQEITHSESLIAEFDKGEIRSSVEQSQNTNIGEAVAAAIVIAALGAGIQGLVPVADEEAPQADATLTVDTTAAPLLSVPSEVVDAGATDIIVDALEQPRSPWTPSYSVTKQGASPSQEEEAEVDYLEPAAQAATTSYSEPLLNEVQEDDPASNALQTRPSYTVAGTEEIAKNEQFLLFGLRAIVAYLWVLPKWLSMTPSDHSRRGSSSSSSSSSKFFPGGWFTPKPNESHTSLDVAQGEFAPSSKVTTSNDVFETLGSEVTDSSAAVNVAAEDDGRKRKWCVVM